MRSPILIQYTTYNFWANEKLLNIISELDESVLNKEIVSSFPSLSKTLMHLWDAETIWLKRLKGESLDDWPSKTFSGNIFDIRNGILSLDKSFIEYVESLDEERLIENFNYKNIEGKPFTNPIWQSILHCMNHSTYHRGQLVTMLRQCDYKNIPATDFIAYCRL